MKLLVACLFLLAGCTTTRKATEPAAAGADDQVVAPKAMYPDDEPAAEGNGDDGPDVICRWEAPTGSRIKKKVCTTRKQREEMRKGARDFMERTRVPETATPK